MNQPPHVDQRKIDVVLRMCQNNRWHHVLQVLEKEPWVALTPMIMANHISTTILHKAITSKGCISDRAKVIHSILDRTPQSAAIKNGYGSLPLHVISQRNTHMRAATKKELILALIKVYKGALTTEGGVSRRTPLHIIFTDYISPSTTRIMIENGREACFKKDNNGCLPAHIACSRHCSPEKLKMLLRVYPGALHEKNNKGMSLLNLAVTSATKSHPNYALIDTLKKEMMKNGTLYTPSPAVALVSDSPSDTSRGRLDSNDSDKSFSEAISQVETPSPTYRGGDGGVKRMSRIVTPGNRDLHPVANLLLQFSRTSSSAEANSPHKNHYAEV